MYPGNDHFYSFLPSFLVGAISARNAFFEKYSSFQLFGGSKSESLFSHIGKTVLLLFACFMSYKLFYSLSRSDPWWLWWVFRFGLFVVFPILFFFEVFHFLPKFKSIMMFLGKHSANIYLTHNFIRVIFFTDFLYTRGHFIAIVLVLLGISVGMSVAIDYLKKITGYIRFIETISRIAVGTMA